MKQEAVAKSFKKCGISCIHVGTEYDAVLEEKVVNFHFSDGAVEISFLPGYDAGSTGSLVPDFSGQRMVSSSRVD